jgi:putative zinc finger/helix-turn-helix YgiT family protein
MTKRSPRRCVHCRERAVSPTIVPAYSMETEHDGRKYAFSVPNLDVLQCEKCRAVVLDDAANERIEGALRDAIGLLSPSEIRRHREALGLNQQQLADFLRISMYTLSRWETGTQIQQRAMDALLRTFFEVPEARRFLGGEEEKPVSSRTAADFLPDLGIMVNNPGGEQHQPRPT